jgi:dihydroorotate dehydrogenase (fumarate)
MPELMTTYMGMALKNPLVAGSSGLTNSVKQIKQLEEAGIGAVILKSLFEEQISIEVNHMLSASEQNYSYPEANDYIRQYTKMNSVQKYLELITEAKAAVQIPIIASINCTSVSEWVGFSADLQKAGADGIELNIYEFASDRVKPSDFYEQKYIDIVRAVKKQVSIPVAVKIAPYFTNLVRLVDQLYANGASAVTLFNRFYEPDFDLDKLEFASAEVMSVPSDMRAMLRWTGVVKGALPNVEIAASTGIHNGKAAIKQLLAGAQVVQLCSSLYLNGFDAIGSIADEIRSFMDKWNFKQIDEFRGRLSYKNIPDPAVYERAQFMKYFSNRK